MFNQLLDYAMTAEYQATSAAHRAKQTAAQRPANRRASEKYRKTHPECIKMRDDAQAFKPGLYQSQRGRCFYCDTALGSTYHLDHKTPLAKGGTNDIRNLCVCCSTCNHRKGIKTAERFMRDVTNYRHISASEPTAALKQQKLPGFND